VAIEGSGDAEQVRRLVARECGLPVRAVRACVPGSLPRLASGKPDYPAIHVLVRASVRQVEPATDPPDSADSAGHADPAGLRRLYAEVLGRPDVTVDSSFVSLGGDSLSYVELSVRLERALGRLPEQWHTTPIRELRACPEPAGKRRTTLETSVALRAVAITLVVGTHAALFGLSGGAHLLLGVAGFNFARFHLTAVRSLERVRHIGRSVARVAVASMTWIALAFLLTDDYQLANVFLLNYVFGSDEQNAWQFWFIESLVYIQLAVLAVLAVPFVDRLERRFPFGLPMGLAALGLITRYELVPGVDLPTPPVVFWLFALGWAAAKASTWWQRLFVTLAIVATVPGFHGSPQREGVMIAGLLLLVWISRLPSVRPLNRLVGLLAGSSLYIYLIHWQVYPLVKGISPLLALVVSLAAGVVYAAIVTRVVTRIAARLWPTVRHAGGRTLRRAVPRLRSHRRLG
jgi:hypothetical protein